MQRTLRWDGIIVQATDGVTPDVVAAVADYGRRERPVELRDRPWDIVVDGVTSPEPGAGWSIVRPFADAGATWWIEANWDETSTDALSRRIAAGPPRT